MASISFKHEKTSTLKMLLSPIQIVLPVLFLP